MIKLLRLVMKESVDTREPEEESVVTRTAAMANMDEDLEKFMDEHQEDIMNAYNNEMASINDLSVEDYVAQDNPVDSEVYDIIAQSMYDDSKIDNSVSEDKDLKVNDLEDENDSDVKADEVINEDSYITINDGRTEDADYLVQDVTELEDLDDGDVEAPSIEGLLSLVNESLSNKYGDTWGILKSKSISMKENLQYAIIDIVTPSILRESKENNIRDNAVSKTVILENVPNSKSLVNLKINTLAGTTRFSQKTREPAKVLTRWLESEYLYDEMVKDFQAKIEARQNELKDTVAGYLKQHPDLKVRIDTIKAQEKLLKDAGILEDSKSELSDLAYGIAAEFPANIVVTGKKDNGYEMEFNTIDEIVKLLFGAEYVREETKDEKELKKQNQKALKGSSLKEGYENFKIGEIEGTFNPSTGEAMYSIPSKNVVDKKISLDKIPSVETPYDTDTIIKDYIEKNYGTIQSDEEPAEDSEGPETLNEPAPTDEPKNTANPDDVEIEEDEEVDTDEQPTENSENKEAQSETGTASFYKIRQNNPITIEDLNEKSSSGANSQESEYIVVKEIDLQGTEADNLLSDLSKPQSFLQGVEPVDRKNYAFNVVKVNTPSQTLLIDNVGYDYPRYIAII